MKIGIVGGGAMGEAITAAILRAELATGSDIRIADIAEARRDQLASVYGVETTGAPQEAAAGADYLILALKPQDIDKASVSLAGNVGSATVASIMAGITFARLQRLLQTESIVRFMSNTPAQIGAGMTVWTATPPVRQPARDDLKAVFAALGKEVFVPDERYLDMATALSGSGPAYVFLFIEALIDAGVHIGFSRDVATTLALQTISGSVRYAEETRKHPAELRAQVTSPAGTTVEALRVLESAGVRASIIEAVIAAHERAQALGQEGAAK
jgi:pyrroline-5-carboxylate reductase